MIIAPDDPNLAAALLDARFARRYLAEGDSWFSLGGLTGNLLMALDAPDVLIVNCAYPGDTLAELGGSLFKRMLRASAGVPVWDGILLSGGGNDLLAGCARFVVPDPAAPIDDDALFEALTDIERDVMALVRECRAHAPAVPVWLHTYDHPPVSRRWRWWRAGPWVAPVLRAAGVDRARWDGIAAMLIDTLAERLFRVARECVGVAVVDTRGCLIAKDWRNEIHPTPTGYHELSRVWNKALNRKEIAA